MEPQFAQCLGDQISGLLDKAWMTVFEEMVDGANHRFKFADREGGFVNYSRDFVHGFKRSFGGRENLLSVDQMMVANVVHVGGSTKFLLAR